MHIGEAVRGHYTSSYGYRAVGSYTVNRRSSPSCVDIMVGPTSKQSISGVFAYKKLTEAMSSSRKREIVQ